MIKINLADAVAVTARKFEYILALGIYNAILIITYLFFDNHNHVVAQVLVIVFVLLVFHLDIDDPVCEFSLIPFSFASLSIW